MSSAARTPVTTHSMCKTMTVSSRVRSVGCPPGGRSYRALLHAPSRLHRRALAFAQMADPRKSASQDPHVQLCKTAAAGWLGHLAGKQKALVYGCQEIYVDHSRRHASCSA